MRGGARRARGAQLAVVALAVAITPTVAAPAVSARPQGPTSIQFFGACVFGVGSGPLQMTMTLSGLTIGGSGSCEGNTGSETASVALQGSGNLGCQRGVSTLSGSLQFDPQPPDSKLSVVATALVGVGAVHLVITDAYGDLYASGDLVWEDGGAPGCVTTDLTGSLSYADS